MNKITFLFILIISSFFGSSYSQVPNGDETYVQVIDGVEYVIHKYTTSGSDSFVPPEGVTEIDVLVVGGGGAGIENTSFTNAGGSGGGAGGLIYIENYDLSSLTFPISVTVGAGGNRRSTTNTNGVSNSGQNTSFGDLIALGGGGAAMNQDGGTNQALSGGSGGGGRGPNTGGNALQPTSTSGGFGHPGGDSPRALAGVSAGGGGGAGSAGQNGTTNGNGAAGGNGRQYDIDGTSRFYAGGGGSGAAQNNTIGPGGSGVGGRGANTNNPATDGAPNTGSGGGGGNDSRVAGNGGSGIVIIRYDRSTAIEFGENEWIAYVYNYPAGEYNENSFDFSDYRGKYIDAGYGNEGISFDSSDSWDPNSNPSTASNYEGSSVTNDYHNVRYLRRGFPEGDYRIDVASQAGGAGHDDAAILYIDGVQVWNNTGCCDARLNVWTGSLDANSEVEFVWSENTGESFGRLRFTEITLPVGNEGDFGDNEWLVSAYNGTNFDTFRGLYSQNALDFDTRDIWEPNGSPSSALNYVGEPVTVDNHSFIYKRRGFPSGFYQLNIPGHDDNVRVVIDGEEVFSSNYTGGGRVENIWQGYLGPDSEIEYSIVEFGGQSFGSLEFASDPNQFVWTGSVDSSVTVLNNWDSALPPNDGTSNIYIPADATNFPVVDINNFVVNNILLEEGASLTLTAELELRGSLINNGTFNAEEGSLNFVGPQNHGIGGNGFAVANLTMDSDLTLNLNPGEEIDLSDILSVDAGTLTTNDRLNLTCSFTSGKTAQVGPVGGSITGEVSVEQCYPARRAFRLVASSVTTTTSIRENWQEDPSGFDDDPRPGYGTHITGISPGAANANIELDGDNGFDYTPSGNASMFTFDNVERSWDPVISTLNNLEVGQPYRLMIRGNREVDVRLNDSDPSDTKLSARGTLHVGPYTIDTNLNDTINKLNLIANPYHAQIDTRTLIQNSDDISGLEYYIWDPTLGGTPTVGVPGGRGAFVTYDLLNDDADLLDAAMGDPTEINISRFIQPMQGFLVRTSGTAPVIRFSEAIKAVEQEQTQTKSLEEVESIGISLFDAVSYAEGNTPSDILRIKFKNSFSTSTKDDSPKLGNLDENLSREENGKSFAIDRRPLPEEAEELMLSIKRYRRSSYVMVVKVSDGLGSKVFIKDNYLDKTTEITKNQSNFSFEVDQSVPESSADDRFSILLDPIRLSTREEEQLASLSLYPNPTRGNFSISGLESATDTGIEIYNLIGQQVYKRSAKGQSSVEVSDFNASTGVYLVKLKSDQGEKTFKLIKE